MRIYLILFHKDVGGSSAADEATRKFNAMYTTFLDSYEPIAVRDLCLDGNSEVVKKELFPKSSIKQEAP